jgi:beta-glucosidase
LAGERYVLGVADETNTFRDAAAAREDGVPLDVAAAAVVAKMTPHEKLWCLDGDLPFWAGLEDLQRGGYHKRPFPAARIERLGVPGLAFSDGPRGLVVGPATCFPVAMARGAAWDVELEERIGEAIGRELQAVGATLFGGVCVNVLRHPAWGRAQETYGEDPFHVGELGSALVRGVQRHAMATVKHFACNSMENARFTVDITVDDVALHEVYLPHFRRIVDEGVAVVMSAYNSLNGEWCGQNRRLLGEILRDEWAFEGIVISDFIFGVRDGAGSVTAGLDVEMPYRMVRAGGLADALERGSLSWDDVDHVAVRIIATLLRFEHLLSAPRPDLSVLACPAHRDLAREAAAKSVVLLQNDPVGDAPLLPLRADALRRLAVIGRLADVRNTGDGGSSDVWAPEVVTPLQGLRAALPGVEVVFDDGSDVDRAAALADASDVALVIVGYTKADEGEFIGDTPPALRELLPGADDPGLAQSFTTSLEIGPTFHPPADVAAGEALSFATGGDRASLRLHPADEELIGRVALATPRAVVAIVAGSAVIMSSWSTAVPAIVQSWYAGMEGGHGLADVLLGRHNADGRLPFSVPTSEEHLPEFQAEAESFTYDRWHGWWKLERDGHRPQFPFGFGLSYSTFARGEFTLTRSAGHVVVHGSVSNDGPYVGADVVQLYGGYVEEDPTVRPRRLVGFARVEVPPGRAVPVEIVVPLARFTVRDPAARRWQLRPGRYVVEVARHAGDVDGQSLTFQVDDSAE